MKIPSRTLIIILFVAEALLPAAVFAQQPVQQKTPAPLSIEQVKDNLYMISGEGGNVALFVTDSGAVLVDDMFDRNHEGILEQVASVTDQPLKFVFNTHQHDDHAGGDLKMLAIADVIAQRNVRINLSDIKQPYYEDTPGTPIGLPTISFTDGLSLFLGGKEVQALYFGRGHTNGDAIIYFPELKAIHTGDLFLNFSARVAERDAQSKPPGANIYVDYAQGGSFLEWTRTLDRVLELDFDTVIPGHGAVGTYEDVVRFRADVEAMRDRIAGLIRRGASKQEVVDVFESDYGWKATGCPPSPPTAGCLQFQQMDSLIAELKK